jgi:hypothetical protein
MFPLVVAIPAALLLIKIKIKSSLTNRGVGLMALGLVATAAGYYESRVGWIAAFAMVSLAPLVMGIRKGGLVLIATFLLFSLVFCGFSNSPLASPRCTTILSGEDSISETDMNHWRPGRYGDCLAAILIGTKTTLMARESDADRWLHTRAALNILQTDTTMLLFGGGMYSHRTLLGSEVKKLYGQYLPKEMPNLKNEVRTTGLPALLVDAGLCGAMLVLLTLIYCGRALVARADSIQREASVPLLALTVIPAWLMVSNIQDMMLYLWLMMPDGLFVLLLGVGKLADTIGGGRGDKSWPGNTRSQ